MIDRTRCCHQSPFAALWLQSTAFVSDTFSEPELLDDSQRDYPKLAAGHSSNHRHGKIGHTPHLDGNRRELGANSDR